MDNHKTTNSKLYAGEWNEVADMFMKVMRIPKISTSQRDALTPDNGMLIYNTDNNRFERYENGAWGPFGSGGEGITKLSELTIDVTKDWLEYDISNIGSLIPKADSTSLLGDDDHKFYRLVVAGYLKGIGAATTSLLLGFTSVSEYARIIIDHNGKISWGVGTSDVDTFLYRDAANKLKTSGGLEAKYLIVTDGSGAYVKVPILTTEERDALTPTNGMVIYNSSLSKFQGYEAGSWVNIIGSGGGFSGNLSDLTIDCDKNWNQRGITNLADLWPIASGSGEIGQWENTWANIYLNNMIYLKGASSSHVCLTFYDPDDTKDIAPQFQLQIDGKHSWGTGGVLVPDTHLYRAAAGVLKTDGSFKANKLFIGDTEIVSNLRVLENIASFSFTPKPTSDGGYDLGTAAFRFGTLYAQNVDFTGNIITSGYGDFGSLKIGGTEVISSGRILKNIVSFTGSLLPTIAQTYDIGSSTYDWNKIYASYLYILGSLCIDYQKNASFKTIKNNDLEIISSINLLHNVTASADIITSGTFAEARIPHTWTSAFTLNADLNLNGSVLFSTDRLYIGLPTSKVAARIYFTDDMNNGKLEIGSDCNLYRNGADILKTDDSFSVTNLYIGGSCVIPSTKRLQNMADIIFPSSAYGTPSSGSSYWDAATKKLYIYDGSAWKSVQLS